MSLGKDYVETLSKEELIELSTELLLKLENEGLLYFNKNSGEPIWCHGEPVIKTKEESTDGDYVDAVKDIRDMVNTFISDVREKMIADENPDENEIIAMDKELDDMVIQAIGTDEYLLDCLKLGVMNGEPLEKMVLTIKISVQQIRTALLEM